MGSIDEFSLPVRLFLKSYRWRRAKAAWAPLEKPLEEATVALVSSAGLVPPGVPPFDPNVRGGDPSYRLLPRGLDTGQLIDSQRSESYDHSGIAEDANLAFPLDRLEELFADGEIGAVAERHVSLMGSITAPGRLLRDTAPAVADLLAEDGVDLALLVPV